jgi:hypothetical protein
MPMVTPKACFQHDRNMTFPSAWPTDQNHIFSRIYELSTMTLTHEGFIDFAGGEVEPGQVFACRDARGLRMIGDRAHLLFCHFGLE